MTETTYTVTGVAVSLPTGAVTVTVTSEKPVDEAQVSTTIEDTGYQLAS